MFLLFNGFIYVTPCQSHFSRQSIDDFIKAQFDTMLTTIKGCLGDNFTSVSDQRAREAFPELKSILDRLYTSPLPRKLAFRAQKESKTVKRLQHRLRNNPHIVITRADKSNLPYIGLIDEFQRKAMEYMSKTNAYEELPIDICPLADVFQKVVDLLNRLLKSNAITKQQHKELHPHLGKLVLAHLYFIPKPHKVDTPLRPISSCINGPTTWISSFLQHLLGPVFLKVAQQTTFINSIDVVRSLEKYQDSGRLKSTTLFVTFDVTNLYTMIPRDEAISRLGRFLSKHLTNGKIGNISIDTILRLTRLILNNHCFAYNGKYYRQIKGGAMGSAFTQTLANIYMLEWEQPLVEHQRLLNELYGRYIDDVFTTTNLPRHEIIAILDKANKKDSNIEITYSVQSAVDFLDVAIANNDGQLKTSVFHKPSAEPYILPYTSDHPHHIHRNIPYTTLLRAARMCSSVEDFEIERVNIDMSLLLNGYPSQFIAKHFHRFFELNDAMPVLNQLNVESYRQLHHKLLYHSTRREKELQKSNQKPMAEQQYPTMKQPWNKMQLKPKYTFESGASIHFPQEFKKWWKKHYIYPKSMVNDVDVKIATKSNRTLESFLVHKKPPLEMLTRMETTKVDSITRT